MEAGLGSNRSIYDIRVALVSTGLSHIQRGYEAFIQDLYDTLKDVGSVTLFKGSGWSAPPNIYTVPTLTRNSPWAKRLAPDDENRRYRYEQISNGLGGWLYGYWKNYDIIHFCDPTLGNVLLRLRKAFGYEYKLLFANCGPAEPHDYKQFDYIQEFTPSYLEKARQEIRKTRLSMIPMGIWSERFGAVDNKQAVRAQYGLPADKFIVLCVASLDEPYKRQDLLIDAVAELGEDVFLLLVGQNQETDHARSVLDRARERLPGRFRHHTVPYASIPEIYQASDMFVLPSLQEGFGKVYLEAMAARLPLLCHDSANTRWIVKDPRSHIQMEQPGALAAGIRAMRAEGGGLSPLALEMTETNYQWVKQNFHWYQLRGEYIRMYEQIMVLPV